MSNLVEVDEMEVESKVIETIFSAIKITTSKPVKEKKQKKLRKKIVDQSEEEVYFEELESFVDKPSPKRSKDSSKRGYVESKFQNPTVVRQYPQRNRPTFNV